MFPDVARRRSPNTDHNGGSFTPAVIQAAWDLAPTVAGSDPASVRVDRYGSIIARSFYGETSEFGWEIDHIKPVARGGKTAWGNLQPLQWQNNREKGDTYPWAGPDR